MGKKIIFIGLLVSFLSTASAAVVVSIRPLGFIAAAITNGIANITILLPDGASPHNYSLKPSDIEKIKTAELFIWVGSNMETFLDKSVSQLPSNKRIALINDPDIRKLLLKSSDVNTLNDVNALIENKKFKVYNNSFYKNNLHCGYNMHIWMSPQIALIIAKLIYNKLVILYPKYKKQLYVNLFKFDEKLTETDKQLYKILKLVGNKRYFVFHDAYSYFEKRYHLTSLGYFTINPIIQPGARRLYKIRRMLVQKKAVCIFAEPLFSPAVIKTVIKNTDVRIGILDPLGSNIKLSKDSYIEFLVGLCNQFKNCLNKN